MYLLGSFIGGMVGAVMTYFVHGSLLTSGIAFIVSIVFCAFLELFFN